MRAPDFSAWRHKVTKPVVIVAVSMMLLTQYSEYRGWTAGLEGQIINRYLGARQGSAARANPVEVVAINVDDYRRYFNSESPLPALPFKALITTLLGASPAVLGVDIETAEQKEGYGDWIFPISPPIIWATRFDGELHEPDYWRWMLEWRAPVPEGEPGLVLGRPVAQIGEVPLWAVPIFASDEDESIRQVPRVWHRKNGEELLDNTMPGALAAAYCQRVECRQSDDAKSAYIRPVSPDTLHRTKRGLSSIVRCIDPPDPTERATCKKFELLQDATRQPSPMLAGKVVLLGGDYSEDRFKVFGLQGVPGVLLNAAATEAELFGPTIRPFPRFLGVVFDVILGIITGLILEQHGLSLRRRTSYAVAMVVPVFAVSVVLLLAGFLWVGWAVILFGTTGWHVIAANVTANSGRGGLQPSSSHAPQALARPDGLTTLNEVVVERVEERTEERVTTRTIAHHETRDGAQTP